MPTPTEKTTHLLNTSETKTLDIPDLRGLVDRVFVGQRLDDVQVDERGRIHLIFENRQSFIFLPDQERFWIGRLALN